ncbi:fimbria/pilus outer membrane usher protein [Serratia marcescens]|uniref:fimbria/pilus outer membrane usher protein n=1 Tax=Serratia marcescens TaxID=615 RepID=UPI0020A3BCED|nr:fimbria/pilus outer membrane usher protein [Serratia marcescens]
MKVLNKFKLNRIAIALVLSMPVSGEAVEFNTNIIDAEDKDNIDFSRFENAGYVLPGTYNLKLSVNNQDVYQEIAVPYYLQSVTDSEGVKAPTSLPCFAPGNVKLLGLTPAAIEKLDHWHDGQCVDFSQIGGVELQGDLGDFRLNVMVPQHWLEYSDSTWLPPSRWDNGIPGLLFDYNASASSTRYQNGNKSQYASINGTSGANLGAWRLRADYQGGFDESQSRQQTSRQTHFEWNRFYLYRALRDWRATLTLGENYINSDIFDSWRYTGASLVSDERMLPPKLRGYAPEIRGIAETNARVTVTQQARVLYESTVPAGPFTIQDLDSSVRGTLDVLVTEQNGRVQRFQVNTAEVPYLTRPGQIRYKMVSGRPRIDMHKMDGPVFAAGEMSWGMSNRWSLYGGSILAGDYNALAFGVGTDMLQFGTVSLDVTQSMATLPDEDRKQGKSWRVSYSKRFDDLNTDVQFAGYRFSERDYMTMDQFLDARYRDWSYGKEKELYTVNLNKNFTELGSSVSLSYSRRTYWDKQPTDYYSLSYNQYFDLLDWKGLSVGVSASRSDYDGRANDSAYLRLSIPLGQGSASYNGSYSSKRFSQTAGYYGRVGELDNYSLTAGLTQGGGESSEGQFSGYYSHQGELANVSANVSTISGDYTSVGVSAYGGLTVTTKGAALHSGGLNGGTRLMVDTDGVADVPVDHGLTTTNAWGIGVVSGVSSYYRNTTRIDVCSGQVILATVLW